MTQENDTLDIAAAYSLGALDEAERLLFEKRLASGDREAIDAFESMREVALSLPFAVEPQMPPNSLKEELMAAIEEKDDKRESMTTRLTAAISVWRRAFWAASATAAAALLGLVFVQHNYKAQVLRLQAALQVDRQVILTLQDELRDKDQVIKIVRARNNLLVQLEGLEAAPGANGRVLYNPDNRSAMFVGFDLDAPADDKDYQLWMLRGGQPVSAGLILFGENNLAVAFFQTFEDVENLTAFAVTLEPKGGTPQPTGTMVLLGSAAG